MSYTFLRCKLVKWLTPSTCVSHAPVRCLQRRGKKVLVLDPRISGFLGLLAEVPLLKEHGVEQCVPPQDSVPVAHVWHQDSALRPANGTRRSTRSSSHACWDGGRLIKGPNCLTPRSIAAGAPTIVPPQQARLI